MSSLHLILLLCIESIVSDYGKYVLVEEAMNFSAANSYCWTNYRTDLASLTKNDLEEAKSLCANMWCWIGMNYGSGGEVWVDGNAYRLNTSIVGDREVGYCLAMNDSNTLNTFRCQEIRSFLCNAPSIFCDSTWSITDGINDPRTITGRQSDCFLDESMWTTCSMAFEIHPKRNVVRLIDTYIEMSFIARLNGPGHHNIAGIVIKYEKDKYLFIGTSDSHNGGLFAVISACSGNCFNREDVANSQRVYQKRTVTDTNTMRLEILQREFTLYINEEKVDDDVVIESLNTAGYGNTVEIGIFGCYVTLTIESLYIFDKSNSTISTVGGPTPVPIITNYHHFTLFMNLTFGFTITDYTLQDVIGALKNVTEFSIASFHYEDCTQILESVGTIANKTEEKKALVEFLLTELQIICPSVNDSTEIATNYTNGLEKNLAEDTANSPLVAIPDDVSVEVEYVRVFEGEALESMETTLTMTTQLAVEEGGFAMGKNEFVIAIIFLTAFCVVIFGIIVFSQRHLQKEQYERQIDDDIVTGIKSVEIRDKIMLNTIGFNQNCGNTANGFRKDEIKIVDDHHETNGKEIKMNDVDLKSDEFIIEGSDEEKSYT